MVITYAYGSQTWLASLEGLIAKFQWKRYYSSTVKPPGSPQDLTRHVSFFLAFLCCKKHKECQSFGIHVRLTRHI